MSGEQPDLPAVGVTEQERAAEAAGHEKNQLEVLTKSAAWGMLVAFIEDQTTRRTQEVMLSPDLSGEKEMAKFHYTRGECGGMLLVKKFIEEQLQVSRESVE